MSQNLRKENKINFSSLISPYHRTEKEIYFIEYGQ